MICIIHILNNTELHTKVCRAVVNNSTLHSLTMLYDAHSVNHASFEAAMNALTEVTVRLDQLAMQHHHTIQALIQTL